MSNVADIVELDPSNHRYYRYNPDFSIKNNYHRSGKHGHPAVKLQVAPNRFVLVSIDYNFHQYLKNIKDATATIQYTMDPNGQISVLPQTLQLTPFDANRIPDIPLEYMPAQYWFPMENRFNAAAWNVIKTNSSSKNSLIFYLIMFVLIFFGPGLFFAIASEDHSITIPGMLLIVVCIVAIIVKYKMDKAKRERLKQTGQRVSCKVYAIKGYPGETVISSHEQETRFIEGKHFNHQIGKVQFVAEHNGRLLLSEMFPIDQYMFDLFKRNPQLQIDVLLDPNSDWYVFDGNNLNLRESNIG